MSTALAVCGLQLSNRALTSRPLASRTQPVSAACSADAAASPAFADLRQLVCRDAGICAGEKGTKGGVSRCSCRKEVCLRHGERRVGDGDDDACDGDAAGGGAARGAQAVETHHRRAVIRSSSQVVALPIESCPAALSLSARVACRVESKCSVAWRSELLCKRVRCPQRPSWGSIVCHPMRTRPHAAGIAARATWA
eukprot:904320-Prymnesium_polylepis.1